MQKDFCGHKTKAQTTAFQVVQVTQRSESNTTNVQIQYPILSTFEHLRVKPLAKTQKNKTEVSKTTTYQTFIVLTDMLFHPLLWFMHGCVRVTAVILSRRIVAVSHIIISVVALSCNMRIRCIIVHSPIASMSYWIVSIGVLSVNMVCRLVDGVIGSSSHLHLP